jgi:hypothetical protein
MYWEMAWLKLREYWISMAVTGLVWQWLDWYGSDWIGMAVTGLVWQWLDWYASDWIGVAVTGLVCQWLNWCGSDWIGMPMTGFVWQWLDWYGGDWIGMPVTGFVWQWLDWYGSDSGNVRSQSVSFCLSEIHKLISNFLFSLIQCCSFKTSHCPGHVLLAAVIYWIFFSAQNITPSLNGLYCNSSMTASLASLWSYQQMCWSSCIIYWYIPNFTPTCFSSSLPSSGGRITSEATQAIYVLWMYMTNTFRRLLILQTEAVDFIIDEDRSVLWNVTN